MAGVSVGEKREGVEKDEISDSFDGIGELARNAHLAWVGKSLGIWNSYLRYVCWPENKCAVCLHYLLQIINRLLYRGKEV